MRFDIQIRQFEHGETPVNGDSALAKAIASLVRAYQASPWNDIEPLPTFAQAKAASSSC